MCTHKTVYTTVEDHKKPKFSVTESTSRT